MVNAGVLQDKAFCRAIKITKHFQVTFSRLRGPEADGGMKISKLKGMIEVASPFGEICTFKVHARSRGSGLNGRHWIFKSHVRHSLSEDAYVTSLNRIHLRRVGDRITGCTISVVRLARLVIVTLSMARVSGQKVVNRISGSGSAGNCGHGTLDGKMRHCATLDDTRGALRPIRTPDSKPLVCKIRSHLSFEPNLVFILFFSFFSFFPPSSPLLSPPSPLMLLLDERQPPFPHIDS